MVVGAFNQVQQALRWFVDNFRHIADWRATLLRVVTFRDGLLSLSDARRRGRPHRRRPSSAGKLAFDNLSIELPDGARGARRPLRRGRRAANASSSPAVRKRARASCCERGWPVAGRHRDDSAAAADRRDVHAAAALSAVRRPCGPPSPIRTSRTASTMACRPCDALKRVGLGPPDRAARREGAMGQVAVDRRTAAPGAGAAAAASADLGLLRRHHDLPERRALPPRAVDLRQRAGGGDGDRHRQQAARSMASTRARFTSCAI